MCPLWAGCLAETPGPQLSFFLHISPLHFALMDIRLTYSDQTPYYVAFSIMPTIGPHSLGKLLKAFETPQEAYKQKSSDLIPIIGKKKTENLITFREKCTPHRILESLINKNIQIVTPDHIRNVKKLSYFSSQFTCLYIKGSTKFLSENIPNVAIVGTRKPTRYGLQNTLYFSQQLTSAGFSITSGMAVGIDTAAHQACIDSKGYTVAIIGCGILIQPTPSQKGIYHAILTSGGTIISEFPPYAQAQPGHFVIRNRLISGLTDATLVIEGTARSGACITARNAAEQGKDVYCIPGNIDSDNAACTNRLIQNGAHLVTSPDDIIAHFPTQPNITNLSIQP